MAEASKPAARKALAVARRAFVPLALTGLGWAAYEARGELGAIIAQARTWPLLTAMLAWAALNLLVPAISMAWLRGLGTPFGYRILLRIHLDRLPARYLPGGIWHTVTRFMDLFSLGADRNRLTALALLENLAPPALALVLAGVCLGLTGRYPPSLVALLVLGGAGLAVSPLLILRLWMRSLPTPPPARSGAAFAGLALFWVIASFAFATYWSAFPSERVAGGLPEVAGAYLLGWAVGFAAVFAPQGIGVFEAMVTWLLGDVLPFASLVLLVAGFRAVTIAGDLLAYLLSRVWLRGDTGDEIVGN